MEQIFTGELKDRERELAELADFCARAEGPAYTWWQAPAWAGKSALMATLALHPPEGVRVVPFFVTARLAGQNGRTAFLDAVMSQLEEITRQPLPDVLTESNRQHWFLQLLEDAAKACAAEDHRLVLLVDGLDEDQGVTRGGHSIAALLPGELPPGMRVVVAGRPNPPVPGDVPHRHPLRDPGIVRMLEPSPWAVAVRDRAESEIADLLDGGGLGRELLGLVVAGGGLSGRDLAELTDEPVGEIERILYAVTGRSFTSRAPQWMASSGDRLFLLAHEELVRAVQRSLRTAEVADIQETIHRWADRYRDNGWPPETPEYLLRGYLSLLYAAGDVERMRAIATDRARLDRMLDVSGGDAMAMADITAVQEYIRDQDRPDLVASLHLALTRWHLLRRNSNIPTNLPAGWAWLGNPHRARALARSIADPKQRVRATMALVDALAEIGDLERARQVTDDAEAAVHSITEPHERAWAVERLVETLVKVGDPDRAEAVARSITERDRRARALMSLMEALVEAHNPDRAEAAARSITEPDLHAKVLRRLVTALVEAGDPERARRVAGEAEAAAYSLTEPALRAESLCELAEALVKAEEPSRARQTADEAVSAAHAISEPGSQADVLAGALVRTLTKVGDLDRAEEAARSIPDPRKRAGALSALVNALAEGGKLNRARQVATDAETAIRSITDTTSRAWALATLVMRTSEGR